MNTETVTNQFYETVKQSACGILNKATDSAMLELSIALETASSFPFFIDAIYAYANKKELGRHLASLTEIERVFNAYIDAKCLALQEAIQAQEGDK